MRELMGIMDSVHKGQVGITDESITEDTERKDSSTFKVVRTGGSIGERPATYYFDSREEAMAYAKSRRKQLTPGEKSYYGVKYSVKPLSKNENRLNESWGMEETDKLFDELVPGEGPAATVEGEMIRAIVKIIYRYYNDGDYFYKGYGVETAGAPAQYLEAQADKLGLTDLYQAINAARYKTDEYDYEKALGTIEKMIVDYVTSKKGEYTKNSDDMLSPVYHKAAEHEFDSSGDNEEEDDDDEDWDDEVT